MTRTFRRGVWLAGTPIRAVLVGLIVVYRVALAGALGGQCRFHPSCSRYAEEAIRTLGAVRGVGLAAWRVVRCNPFGRGGSDPVPRPAGDRGSPPPYDSVIQERMAW